MTNHRRSVENEEGVFYNGIRNGGGGVSMQVEIKIDSSCEETKVIVLASSMTEEVAEIIARLAEHEPHLISGLQDGKLKVLEETSLIRVYAGSGKVFGVTEEGEYVLKKRLYELEELLDKTKFVRISNSEIINLKKVKHFDLSFTGTICVRLSDGTAAYVSRRYVNKIKKILGV